MKTIFTTFCFTSLVWSLCLLYCFASGTISREPLVIQASNDDLYTKPVKLNGK